MAVVAGRLCWLADCCGWLTSWLALGQVCGGWLTVEASLVVTVVINRGLTVSLSVVKGFNVKFFFSFSV